MLRRDENAEKPQEALRLFFTARSSLNQEGGERGWGVNGSDQQRITHHLAASLLPPPVMTGAIQFEVDQIDGTRLASVHISAICTDILKYFGNTSAYIVPAGWLLLLWWYWFPHRSQLEA